MNSAFHFRSKVPPPPSPYGFEGSPEKNLRWGDSRVKRGHPDIRTNNAPSMCKSSTTIKYRNDSSAENLDTKDGLRKVFTVTPVKGTAQVSNPPSPRSKMGSMVCDPPSNPPAWPAAHIDNCPFPRLNYDAEIALIDTAGCPERRSGSPNASSDFEADSDSGWGTESEGHDRDHRKIESWESEFSARVEPIKADFKDIAHRVQSLMVAEATISQNLSMVVETSQSNERELFNEITGEFGETLENAVKINDNIHDLQRKLKGLNGRIKKRKEEFINDLAALKAKNSDEIDEFKEELANETDGLPAKIQAAKSTKAEQKQVHMKLAKILADGMP
ncbi:hypothetical protein H4Q26_014947 [Puccinia striiformis f. sp. tritici PST-130]|nr:hypothetical protein H4Q26_014947 [Puccinia striiformis f. sp. tritici PST-130]